MNRIEALKQEKDGLDVLEDLARFAREGWKTIGTTTRSGSSGRGCSTAGLPRGTS